MTTTAVWRSVDLEVDVVELDDVRVDPNPPRDENENTEKPRNNPTTPQDSTPCSNHAAPAPGDQKRSRPRPCPRAGSVDQLSRPGQASGVLRSTSEPIVPETEENVGADDSSDAVDGG